MKDIKKITVDRILRSTWKNSGDFAWKLQHTDFGGIEAVKDFVETFLIMTRDRGSTEEWQEYLKSKQESFRAWWRESELLEPAKKRGWAPLPPPTQDGTVSMKKVLDEDQIKVSARRFDSFLERGKFNNARVVGISPAYGMPNSKDAFLESIWEEARKSKRFYYFGQGDIFLCVAEADFDNGVSVGGLRQCDYCGKAFKRKGELRKGGQPSKYCGKSCANFANYYWLRFPPPPPPPNLKKR